MKVSVNKYENVNNSCLYLSDKNIFFFFFFFFLQLLAVLGLLAGQISCSAITILIHWFTVFYNQELYIDPDMDYLRWAQLTFFWMF